MIISRSIADAIINLHLAKAAGFQSVIVIKTTDYYKSPVLLVLPYTEILLHGIFNHYTCRVINL